MPDDIVNPIQPLPQPSPMPVVGPLKQGDMVNCYGAPKDLSQFFQGEEGQVYKSQKGEMVTVVFSKTVARPGDQKEFHIKQVRRKVQDTLQDVWVQKTQLTQLVNQAGGEVLTVTISKSDQGPGWAKYSQKGSTFSEVKYVPTSDTES